MLVLDKETFVPRLIDCSIQYSMAMYSSNLCMVLTRNIASTNINIILLIFRTDC